MSEPAFYTHTPLHYQPGEKTDHGVVQRIERVTNTSLYNGGSVPCFAVYCDNNLSRKHEMKIKQILFNVALIALLFLCIEGLIFACQAVPGSANSAQKTATYTPTPKATPNPDYMHEHDRCEICYACYLPVVTR